NGVAMTLARLVDGLRSRGHAVSVVRPRQRVDRRGPLRDPEEFLVHGAPLPGYGGLQIGLPAAGALRRHWTRHRPDVVYVATEGPLGWSAVRAATRLRLPVVSGFHTNFHSYAKHYHAGWIVRVVAGYLRRFHNRTTATVVATADLRARLNALGFTNLSVLGRGVDSGLFTPERRCAALRAAWGVSEHDTVALYVGRIAPEKNLELAVEAYRAMQRVGGARRFVLVGDGPQRAALQKRHPDLVFCGAIIGEQLAAHYASADVFLFPSETETFGNVVLEAMASGLALVAYDYAAARMHVTHGETGVLIPYGQAAAFVAGAAEPWVERRQQGLGRLASFLRARYARCADWGDALRTSFSDLRFTDANRVPFPFARFMRDHFDQCAVVTASDGPRLQDLDGHWTLDVGGSYGVNVAGFARYKEWMARGLERVQDLGPVLGPLHPVVAENTTLLKSVSGLDEVSFHMSGTEAVMAAVRMARF